MSRRHSIPTPETMRLYVNALRPLPAHNAQALPLATAKQEADILIKRAHDSAPMFGDIDPPLPAVESASETAQEPLQSAQGDGVDTTQPPEPAVPRTGLNGRQIITMKKVRRVLK